jgi:hypothetical protein
VGRPAIGRQGFRVRLHRLRLSRSWLRLLLRLWLRLLRCLRLLVLLRGLLACGSAVLGFAQSRKLTGKNRLFIARRYLLRVKRNVQLNARLTAAILRVLAGIECSQQLLD